MITLYKIGYWLFLMNFVNSIVITIFFVFKSSKSQKILDRLLSFTFAVITGLMIILSGMPLLLLNNPKDKAYLDVALVVCGVAYALITTNLSFFILRGGAKK